MGEPMAANVLRRDPIPRGGRSESRRRSLRTRVIAISLLVAAGLGLDGCTGGAEKDDLVAYARPFPQLQPKVNKVLIAYVQVTRSMDPASSRKRLQEEILPAAEELLAAVKKLSPATGTLKKAHADLVKCWTDRVTGYRQEIKRLEGEHALLGAAPKTFMKSDIEALAWWDRVIGLAIRTGLSDDPSFEESLKALEFMGKQTQTREDITMPGRVGKRAG